MHLPYPVEPARPDERQAAFHLIFRHAEAEERELRVSNAMHLMSQGELDPAGLVVVRDPAGLLGAMIALPVPGASGLVWPPQAQDCPEQRAIEDELTRHSVAWLRRRGAKLAQTLLPKQDRWMAAPLERNGFAHITSLWFLRHDLDGQLDRVAERLTYQSYRHGDRALFHEVLLRSYDETLDCPEVNGVRELTEVIEGHQAQGAYDPERWWLALRGGQPVAVLLLTEMRESGGWDLSYLGVVPEARRTGIGRELTCLALQEAKAAGARHMTLSVDARNQPAWDLYTGLGFEPFDQREVFLAVWNRTGPAS